MAESRINLPIQVKYMDTRSSGDDGITPFSDKDILILSADAEGNVLVPYVRNTDKWAIRIAGGGPYVGNCRITYIDR